MKKIIQLLATSFVSVFLFGMLATPAFAEDPFIYVCNGDATDSSVCKDRTASKDNPLLGESGTITKVIELLTIVIGVVSVLVIIIGGFKYILSAGDANATKSARDTIMYAVIGLVVAIFARAIVVFVVKKL